MNGKFVVIYGSNNIGKSTQIQHLQSTLLNSMVLKYPIYESVTGKLLNRILRDPTFKHSYSEGEIQNIFAQNKREFEPTLLTHLASHRYVVAEDYIGTSIAWGMTRGVSFEELQQINQGLLQPDLAILLDSEERFRTNIENTHKNENNDQLWKKNRDIFRELASLFNWQVIKANQSIEQVHKELINVIQGFFEQRS